MSGRKMIVMCVAGACGAATLLVHAAQPPQLNVKMGLWEVVIHPQVTGSIPISDEQLQKMSPDQRARIEAAVQAGMAQANQPRLMKECMTAEKLAQGFNAGTESSASCQTTVVVNTRSEMETHRDCATGDGKRSMVMHILAPSSERVTGTVHGDITRGTRTMTVNSTVEGKWLGADCGGIKDAEIEKSVP
jgi:hypothetical protein